MAEYSKYITYITKLGDRPDTVAYKFYGNCFNYKPILDANPQLPISPFLPVDKEIIIPFFDDDNTSIEELPPWKR